jgi:hypothetical protein
MTTSDKEDQAERRRVLREQAATYHSFAENELVQSRGVGDVATVSCYLRHSGVASIWELS